VSILDGVRSSIDHASPLCMLDDRFEQHDGTKIIELSPGRLGILSHGWVESKYLHLWEPE
jgi:hypothetical protein